MNTFNGTPNSELISYSTASMMASEYVAKTAQIIACLEAAIAQTANLNAAFNLNNRDSFNWSIYVDGCRHVTVDGLLQKFKLAAWAQIIERTGVRKLMSSSRAEQLNNILYSQNSSDADKLPDITEESIMDVIHGYAASAEDLLKESIDEVYDHFKTHRESWAGQLKTHQKSLYKLDRKLIKYAIEWGYKTPRLNHRYEKHYIALDNVFHLLDGQGVTKGHRGDLSDAIYASNGEGESKYFSFKCFHNGNIHLTFKRQDLLDKFNLICGRNRLGNEVKSQPGKKSERQLATC